MRALVADRALRVDGLRQLQDDLELMGDSVVTFTELALVDAADLVVVEARKRAGKDRRTGRAMNSIRTIHDPHGQRVTGGGPNAEHFAWTDFGGSTKRWPAAAGKPMARKFIPTGRYIYPALKSLSQDIEDVMSARLDDIAEGLDG